MTSLSDFLDDDPPQISGQEMAAACRNAARFFTRHPDRWARYVMVTKRQDKACYCALGAVCHELGELGTGREGAIEHQLDRHSREAFSMIPHIARDETDCVYHYNDYVARDVYDVIELLDTLATLHEQDT